jgi:benzoyl-CoA reductase/2-hydroxyglutaryl-CoA dehydratase subunit BcrC/BadD/HgdB
MFMPVEEHSALLRELLVELEGADGIAGTRVFVTGSEHEYTEVYEEIESSGCVVVGEDHDWGNRAFSDVVDVTAPPIDALADAYQFGAPASAKYSIAERAAYTAEQARATGAEVVLAVIRPGDDAPLWDLAHQRKALAEHGIALREGTAVH